MLQTYKTILTKKTQLNSNTYLYRFDLLVPKEIIFKPGQYVILRVPTGKGFMTRLYSIASSPNSKNSLELIIAIIPGGLASNYFISLKENTEIIFYGVAGMFGLKENEKNKVFLVTGTGIAPIRSMLTQIQNSEFRIQNFLFWGLKNYKDVYLLDELKQLSSPVIPTEAGIQTKICLSREQNFDMMPAEDKRYFDLGHVDNSFDKLLTTNYPLLTNSEFYLCGARQVVESLRIFLLSKNIAKENIYFEKF